MAEIDSNNVAKYCIFLAGGNFGVTIENVTCKNIPMDWKGIQLNFGCYNNTINNNTILLIASQSNNETQGICIIGKRVNPQGNYFDGSGAATLPDIPTYNNIISNNYIYEGSHGILIMGGLRNVVIGNTCTHQAARSILVGEDSFNNIIDANLCTYFYSSGIHVGYNSHDNLVTNNYLYAPQAGGEGGLQAYLGCSGNVFENNFIHCTSNYGIYIGVTSSSNSVTNNRISGYARAGIAIESDWNNTLPTGANFSKPSAGTPPSPYSSYPWAFANSDNNIISNNLIGAGSVSNAAAIYIASVNGAVSGQPVYAVQNTVINGNTINTESPDYLLYIFEETPEKVTAITMNSNNFQTIDAAKFHLPRGRANFFEVENNSVINNGIIAIPNSATTPDVAIGRLFICNNSSATSITNFINGKVGQEIIVKLDVNTTIIHNTSFIRLKGGINATGNADNLITFMYISNIWFEISRNF